MIVQNNTIKFCVYTWGDLKDIPATGSYPLGGFYRTFSTATYRRRRPTASEATFHVTEAIFRALSARCSPRTGRSPTAAGAKRLVKFAVRGAGGGSRGRSATAPTCSRAN